MKSDTKLSTVVISEVNNRETLNLKIKEYLYGRPPTGYHFKKQFSFFRFLLQIGNLKIHVVIFEYVQVQ